MKNAKERERKRTESLFKKIKAWKRKRKNIMTEREKYNDQIREENGHINMRSKMEPTKRIPKKSIL